MGQQINPTHKENDSHSPGFWRRAFLSSKRSVIGCELYLGRFAVSVNCVPVKSIVKLGNASDTRNKGVAMMTVHIMSQWTVHLFAVRMLGVLIYASVELGFRRFVSTPLPNDERMHHRCNYRQLMAVHRKRFLKTFPMILANFGNRLVEN